MTNPPTILLTRLATSGFHATKGHILEVACILAELPSLQIVDTTNVVIAHIPRDLQGAPDFHEALVAECVSERAHANLRQTEGFLLAGPWTTAHIVCARALTYFQLPWLRHHMPTFATALDKMEVLELKVLEKLSGKTYTTPAGRSYRAADDVIADYEELLGYGIGGVK